MQEKLELNTDVQYLTKISRKTIAIYGFLKFSSGEMYNYKTLDLAKEVSKL